MCDDLKQENGYRYTFASTSTGSTAMKGHPDTRIHEQTHTRTHTPLTTGGDDSVMTYADRHLFFTFDESRVECLICA